MQGEWQYFRFALPGFVRSPAKEAVYGQVKKALSPRFFAAVRISDQRFGRIEDSSGATASYFAGPQQTYEFTLGYRPNRQQLLKTGFAYTDQNRWAVGNWLWPRTSRYAFELQLVTSLVPVSKAWGAK